MSDKRLIDANALLDQNNWTIKQYSEEEADAWRDGIALMKKNIENAPPPSTRKPCGLRLTSFMAPCLKLRMEYFAAGAGALLGWKPAILPNTPLFAGIVAQRWRNDWRCT